MLIVQRGQILHRHLHEEAEVGEHSKAAVLDLLDAQLSEGVGVVSQAKGVKGLACMRTNSSAALQSMSPNKQTRLMQLTYFPMRARPGGSHPTCPNCNQLTGGKSTAVLS